MSTYRLDKLFAPRSLALVGASPREGSLGHAVLRNLREAGFPGRIDLVNPKYAEVDGAPCAARIENLADAPDLAVIAAPPAAVPGLVAVAGRRGVAAAIVLTGGLGHGPGSLADAARVEARTGTGFGSSGRIVSACSRRPAGSTPASRRGARTPETSRSFRSRVAIAAGLVEWAAQRHVGFSAVVSLGDNVDVDFGDCLDYFAIDRATRAILLYIEAVNDARKFMSAARAAARAKPVVVIKSGRHAQGAKAAATHTGALAGADAVYEAAFRRAGLLRVSRSRRDLRRRRDARAPEAFPGQAPRYPDERRRRRRAGGRPADRPRRHAGRDLGRDHDRSSIALCRRPGRAPIRSTSSAMRTRRATPARWKRCSTTRSNDAVLVLNVPTALASASEAAEAVVEIVQT